MECFCRLRSVRDTMTDGNTRSESLFPFDGRVILSGADVAYKINKSSRRRLNASVR